MILRGGMHDEQCEGDDDFVGKDRWYLRYKAEAGYQVVYLSSVIIDTSLLDVERKNYTFANQRGKKCCQRYFYIV